MTGPQGPGTLRVSSQATETGLVELDPLGKLRRTHCCGELRPEHVGQEIVICGWVHRRRDHGGVIFTGGNNSNSGRSPSAPLATIVQATTNGVAGLIFGARIPVK